MILNDRPQAVEVTWTGTDPNGNIVVVTPDAVDFSITDPSLGSLTALDVNNATYAPNAGTTGSQTFGAVSHQNGLADFTAGSATDDQVNPPPPPPVQIDGGQVVLPPQAGAGARATAKVQITGASFRRR